MFRLLSRFYMQILHFLTSNFYNIFLHQLTLAFLQLRSNYETYFSPLNVNAKSNVFRYAQGCLYLTLSHIPIFFHHIVHSNRIFLESQSIFVDLHITDGRTHDHDEIRQSNCKQFWRCLFTKRWMKRLHAYSLFFNRKNHSTKINTSNFHFFKKILF